MKNGNNSAGKLPLGTILRCLQQRLSLKSTRSRFLAMPSMDEPSRHDRKAKER
jgi:hypothetical protein